MITSALLVKLLLSYVVFGFLIAFIGMVTLDNNKLQGILKKCMLVWAVGIFFFLLALIWVV
jgi:membrane-anchored glycerophosphoryl diester phosphodiesterase (GDPDase)